MGAASSPHGRDDNEDVFFCLSFLFAELSAFEAGPSVRRSTSKNSTEGVTVRRARTKRRLIRFQSSTQISLLAALDNGGPVIV
jgi:hypothetical protein